jgi:glycosyltransferase involved in cell wall biosynthesis
MLVSRPFGLEVVGDPADVFTHEAIRDRLAFAYRWWFTRSLRRQCLRASGVAYVTRHALQQRYPSRALSLGLSDVDLPETALTGGPMVYTTYFSSIELKETHLAEHPRTKPTAATKIVTVGSLAQLYKGTDLLIDAVAGCRRRGVNLQLTIVGDGKYRPELEARVRRLDLAEHVFFAGQVTSGDPVRQLLDGSDVFVLPSRCEGLPRAMLEAMGRGLPCIGSAVGGIPELLAPEDIVPPGNVAALIQKISEVANNPTRLRAMSERNLRTAMDYRESVLAERRRRFYRHIRTQTEAWLQESP